jgi:hypothetical protein
VAGGTKKVERKGPVFFEKVQKDIRRQKACMRILNGYG